jgi:hypothetical protein
MARGDKSSYTSKQKRQAEHIAEGYKEKGVSSKTAKSRAWATVNKTDGGGKKSGSGRNTTSEVKKTNGRTVASRSPASKLSKSGQKASNTRKGKRAA